MQNANTQKQAESLAVKPLRQNENNKTKNNVENNIIATSSIASSPIAAARFKDKYSYIPSTKPTVFTPKFSPEVAKALELSKGIEAAYNRAVKDIKSGNC